MAAKPRFMWVSRDPVRPRLGIKARDCEVYVWKSKPVFNKGQSEWRSTRAGRPYDYVSIMCPEGFREATGFLPRCGTCYKVRLEVIEEVKP